MPDDNRSLIASSEFDNSSFIKNIDEMTSSVIKLAAQEDALKKILGDSTKALDANNASVKANEQQLASLQKTSSTYQADVDRLNKQHQQLTSQQKALQDTVKGTQQQLTGVSQSAANYKDALQNIQAVSAQLKANGTNLFNVVDVNQQIQQVTASAAGLRNIFQGKIDTSELDDLENHLASTGDEFERLREVIDFVEQKLSTLDPHSKEFAELTQVVTTGKQVLEQFGQVQENVGKRGQTATTHIRELRNQLTAMTVAGEEGTEKFKAIEKEAAELQHAIDKTSERVRVFASDTQLIQGGVEAIRGIAAGFELAEGTAALFGVRNEGAAEAIKRLTAIMAVANGLQEISNLLKKESAVRLLTETVATRAYTIAQRILAATLGQTAAASKALSIAIAATGIGALVVGIGLLIEALSSWQDASKEATEAQENLNVAVEQGVQDNALFIAGLQEAGKHVGEQAEVRAEANRNIQASDLQALRDRIRNSDEARAIDVRFQRQALEQARRFEESRIAEGDRADQRLRDIAERRVSASDEEIAALKKTVELVSKATDTRVELETKLEETLLKNQRDGLKDRNDVRRLEYQQTLDFLKRLEDLRNRLLTAQNKQGRQDEAQLAKQANDNLQAELRAIDRDVQQGKLTGDRGNVLKKFLQQINGVELTTELREFRKKSVQAQQSIEDEIFDLRLTAGEQRTTLLRDQLVREGQTVEDEFKKEFNKLEVDRTQLLQGVRDAFDQGLISEGQFIANSDKIKAIYTQLFQNLTDLTRRKQEELARLTFQRSQEMVQELFAPSFTGLTETTTKELAELTKRYVANRITYQKYQEELTLITLKESRRRIELQITEDEQLLEGLRRRRALELDPQEGRKLEEQILQLREQIAQLRRQAAEGEASQEKALDDAFKRKVERIASYAQAIGSVVEQVVKFWQVANEAEAKALDRSITLQQRRVDAATKVAERGNAEYLRLEEDRLNQLRIQQENNARRQLALNAILQGSQALVAFTSALAQGISTGGPLGGIAIAAAVLGLLAQGYAIIKSLQDNQPQQLAEGVTFVRRGPRDQPGIDTVPALLTHGEAVLPVDVNKAYHPTVEAMFAGEVPPGVLNAFVGRHRASSRRLPVLAYEQLGHATETKEAYDTRLLHATEATNRLLVTHGDQLGALEFAIRHLHISQRLDRDGFTQSVTQLLAHNKKQKKV